MNYCINCIKKLKTAEIIKMNECPKCQHEIREIKNTKLSALLEELDHATQSLNSSATLKANPKKLIEISKIIEKGEKSLQKEYERRIEDLKVIAYENSVIETYNTRMGYNPLFETIETIETIETTETIEPENNHILPDLTLEEIAHLRASNDENISDEDFEIAILIMKEEKAKALT